MESNVYKAVCEFIAKTQLYCRELSSSVPEEYDETACFPINEHENSMYESMGRETISGVKKKYGVSFTDMVKEVRKHREYTVQKWIDEYERLSHDKQ